MPAFDYKAKAPNGDTINGRFDAADRSMVISLLKGKGFFPIEIKENVSAGKEVKFSSLKKVTIKDIALFCRQFQTMLDAGVSILACLDMLRKQTENPKLSDVIGKVYDDVQKGKSLSESMKTFGNVFPVLLTSMVEVGEVSGTLDAVLDRLSVHFEKENKMKQKITTAMVYPAAIGSIAVVMVIFMLTFIVPKFVAMTASVGGTLPTPTLILLKVSGALTNIYFLLTAAACISLIVYVFRKYKATAGGKYTLNLITLKIPLVGINVSKILASRFTRTLSSLLNTGVPLIQALEVVEKVLDNQIVTRGMVKVKEDIKRGSNLAGPLEGIGIFPAMVTQMISIGEESGSLDSIMGKVADFYDDEVDASISKLIALMEPVMIFILAGIVGSIVVAMIMPVFSMYGNVGK